jgi:hypothetical protein
VVLSIPVTILPMFGLIRDVVSILGTRDPTLMLGERMTLCA